jgi:hypothetical protein
MVRPLRLKLGGLLLAGWLLRRRLGTPFAAVGRAFDLCFADDATRL